MSDLRKQETYKDTSMFFIALSFFLSILWIVNVIVTVAHIHYGICVVRQMSQHFRIYTFSLQVPAGLILKLV